MGEGGGMAAETHDERIYESFSHAGHDTPFPLSRSFLLRLSPSFFCNLCDAHIFTSSYHRRRPRNSFPCAYEPDVGYCPFLFLFLKTVSSLSFLIKSEIGNL